MGRHASAGNFVKDSSPRAPRNPTLYYNGAILTHAASYKIANASFSFLSSVVRDPRVHRTTDYSFPLICLFRWSRSVFVIISVYSVILLSLSFLYYCFLADFLECPLSPDSCTSSRGQNSAISWSLHLLSANRVIFTPAFSRIQSTIFRVVDHTRMELTCLQASKTSYVAVKTAQNNQSVNQSVNQAISFYSGLIGNRHYKDH